MAQHDDIFDLADELPPITPGESTEHDDFYARMNWPTHTYGTVYAPGTHADERSPTPRQASILAVIASLPDPHATVVHARRQRTDVTVTK